MKVRVQKLNDKAVIPKYAHDSDAGLDLTCVGFHTDDRGNFVYDTGLAFEIPPGYVGLLFPRSSVCKKDLILTNCVGVIDSGYRGPVMLKYKAYNKETVSMYSVGDRVGQLIIMPYPKIELVESDNLDSSDRGDAGYGSTGK